MPVEEFESMAEQVSDTLSADSVLTWAQQYGPEILTAVLGTVSIQRINTGSSTYKQADETPDLEEKQKLVREASRDILTGGTGLTAISFASGNPLFALPQIPGLLAALKPYVEARNKRLASMLQKTRSEIAIVGANIGTAAYTMANYAESVWDTLPPLGLALITSAFAIGNKAGLQKLYRTLSISGGLTMMLGSGYAMQEAMQQNNHVGAIMSGVFLTLNTMFTHNEVKTVTKKSQPLEQKPKQRHS